ncbi:MAG: 4Fe-4S binding protein [Defluviitaleaceae bacterium]|nr:4Fe-4S binding protein [Defluviitaleaceae bacterium]
MVNRPIQITVGRGSCGIAAGANTVYTALHDSSKGLGIQIDVKSVGCVGLCYLEPVVEVWRGDERFSFGRVNEVAAAEIVKFAQGLPNLAGKYLFSDDDRAFLSKYPRITLHNCGIINPEEIEDYGEYKALAIARSMPPDAVIQTIKASGLTGRGGAGFPTWFKWDAARRSDGNKKYLICNADEGDPGAFMDRAIIEGDPHNLLEGMLIAAYAIGYPDAEVECVVYVRAEYPLAVKRLKIAIEQAEARGLLNDYPIRIKEGAGAFVCGEETALIASLEGERGMPRLKPPFPAQKGLFNAPSNINNVETLANVPYIFKNGAKTFLNIGNGINGGTKVFALTGKIARGGLMEVPMGEKLRNVVNLAGGVRGGKNLKAVQLGGPSGGCIPEGLLDVAVDYKELASTGAIMGSGGMVVMDDETCMVEMSRFFLDFTCKESCGKCVHCRIGTKRMLEVLERIVSGDGIGGDIELLEELGAQLKEGALCQLGMTAPNPVLTNIKYFRKEFEEHINDKRCRAGACKALVRYEINENACVGCTACLRICPAKAVDGSARQKHVILHDKCTKCGMCKNVCRFNAVRIC